MTVSKKSNEWLENRLRELEVEMDRLGGQNTSRHNTRLEELLTEYNKYKDEYYAR